MYLHLVDVYGKLVGEYTSPMDPMGNTKVCGCPVKYT